MTAAPPQPEQQGQGDAAGILTARASACSRISSAWQIVAAHINKPLPQSAAVRIRGHLDDARRMFGGAVMERHPKRRRMAQDARAELKARAVAVYGSRCACCGETEPRALTIDHVEPLAGRKVRGDVYRTLAGLVRPDPRWQVLCVTCNLLKGAAAECPHQSSGLAVWLRRLRRWYERGGAERAA